MEIQLRAYNSGGGGGDSTPEELVAFLSRYNRDLALKQISLASSYFLRNGLPTDESAGLTVTPWALAYIADLAVRNCSPTSILDFKTENLCQAVDPYNRLPEPLQFVNAVTHPTEHYRQLIRLANLQFELQENWMIEAARFAEIIEGGEDEPWRGPAFDIESVIRTRFGTGISGFVRTVLPTVGWMIIRRPKPYLNLQKLSQTELAATHAELSLENLRRVLGELRTNFETARSLPTAKRAREGFEKYEWSLLRKTPLVAMAQDRYYVPNLRLLAEWTGKGLFYYLCDEFRGSGAENAFRTRFGFLFQAYVGRLLSEARASSLAHHTIFREFEYSKGVSSPDWIIVHGEDALLLECKSGQLSVSAKVLAESDLDQKASGLYKRPVSQLRRFVDAVREGNATFPEGYESIQDVRHFYSLVVGYTPLYLANDVYGELYPGVIGSLPDSMTAPIFASSSQLEQLLQGADFGNLVPLVASVANDATRSRGGLQDVIQGSLNRREPPALLQKRLDSIFPGFKEHREDKRTASSVSDPNAR